MLFSTFVAAIGDRSASTLTGIALTAALGKARSASALNATNDTGGSSRTCWGLIDAP